MAAGFLNISPRHLTRLIDAGQVASFTVGRRRFLADESSSELLAKAADSEIGFLPSDKGSR